jgi:DNA-binding transcriptional LysR family regulator
MAFNRIPPIQCLVTFEAVARLRSGSKAAEELTVTTSAVSHRIRQLEAHLGFILFQRGEFNLTADGAAYLGHVRSGLASLEQMTGRFTGKAAPRLRLAVTPTFGRQLLMPKLELFRKAYPEIELVLQVSIPLLDVKAEPADLEVRFGVGGYNDVEYRLIMEDDLSPACSPSYLHEFGPFDGFATDAEVNRARLIRSPLEPWGPWFAECGLSQKEPSAGSQFNDIGLIYDAAANGFGVTLLRHKMGAAWLESGRLVRLSNRSVRSVHKHFLCWAPGTLDRWECSAFVDWLFQVFPSPTAPA